MSIRPEGRAARVLNLLLIAAGCVVALRLASSYQLETSGWHGVWFALGPGYLALAGLLALAPWFTGAFRLMIWTGFIGQPRGFSELFRIVIATELGSAAVPPAVGGNPVKLALLMRSGLSAGQAASVTTIVALEDLFFFLTVMPLALIAGPGRDLIELGDRAMCKKIGLFVLLGLLAVGAFGLLARRRVVCLGRFGVALRREVAIFAQVLGLLARHGKQRLGLSLLLTAVQWICRYSVLSALVAGLGLAFSPLTFFVLQWAIFALSMFIPTPSGIGGMEALFLLFYQPLLPSAHLTPLMLYWRSFTCYLPLLLDLVILSLFKASARLARA